MWLGDWKLVKAPYLGVRQLFDLGSDPGERRDLLAEPSLDPAARAALEDLERAEGHLLEMNKVDAKGGPIKDGERWVEFGRDMARRKAANGL